ncbi:MAG: DUF2283 domain-containing protein, partial [Euryarchaeota archaeon]|nr:DUF2283 domain-containing protein [Euryarchaeota archaeon]
MVSVEFDREVNALYLRLRKGKVEKSDPVADNIVFDLGEEGSVVGIEILLPKTDPKLLKVLASCTGKAA